MIATAIRSSMRVKPPRARAPRTVRPPSRSTSIIAARSPLVVLFGRIERVSARDVAIEALAAVGVVRAERDDLELARLVADVQLHLVAPGVDQLVFREPRLVVVH